MQPEHEQNAKANFQRKKRERFSAFLAKSERTLKCVCDCCSCCKTLTFIEHEVSAQYEQRDYSLPEQVHRLKSYVQSLQRLYVSCETAASRIENSVPFYPQRLEGQGPGRPALNKAKEQIEYLRSIHFHGKK